jgi:outer membrane murein-binding lipoprotein Lpp
MAHKTTFAHLLTTSMMTPAERAKGRFMRAPVDKLTTKNEELIGENRRLKRGAEIKPEDLTAAEERADKAEARAKELEGSVKSLTKERDTAVKSARNRAGRGSLLCARG